MVKPWHHHHHQLWYTTAEGNWELPKEDGKIDTRSKIVISDILYLCTDLQTLCLNDIAWKGRHHYPHNTGLNCYCCKERPSQRYLEADVSHPGIVLLDAPNPYGLKYRMIDGRHRIMKLLDNGETTGKYYVINFEDVKKHIRYAVSI